MQSNIDIFATMNSGLRSFLGKLRDKYRLIIVSDNTYEERLSLKLSRLNVITIVATAVFIVSLIILLIIIYTPAKELIPGYSDAQAKREARKAIETAERLEADLSIREEYLDNVIRVLRGEMEVEEVAMDTTRVNAETQEDLDFSISERDSALRIEVAAEDLYNLKFENAESRTAMSALSDLVFFTPLKGLVTSQYDIGTEHLGVDVVAPDNETIKAVLDGTVILATWTSQEGYVLGIQHSNDLVSFYKHNSVLLKKTGEQVEAGESIAVMGNSGEITDGPHLHFELWYKGDPLDPEEFIIFN
ncbi:MAG: M23 family metallopeptidase [Flavobacteriales bacterium]|nr:M23 family metallopeptidase [Flavobacteriales bacterium]